MLNLTVHFHASLIGVFLEELGYRDRILCSNDIAALSRTQAPLVGLAERPVAITHLLVEVKGLSEIAPKEAEAHLVL